MSRRNKEELPHSLLHAILLVATLVTVYPILWVLTIALSGKQSLAIADLPATPAVSDRLRAVIPWPESISLANFRSLFADQPFTRWLINSAIVAAATTLLGIFLAATAGYAFSRFRFPARRVGLMSFLVSQMFPGVLTLIPLYIIVVKWLGLGSTRTGLVLVYTTTAIPFCVWMLKGYFDTIPISLEEAGRIDGLTPFGTFWRIVIPLSLPGLAVTFFYSFITAWNEVAFANVLLVTDKSYTLPVGLQTYVFEFSQNWEKLTAAAVIVTLPAVIVFLVAQRYLVSGLTRGGVKG